MLGDRQAKSNKGDKSSRHGTTNIIVNNRKTITDANTRSKTMVPIIKVIIPSNIDFNSFI